MTKTDLESLLTLSRTRTMELLDVVAASAAPAAALAWRPGPGRAHLAWQLMHIAATEDRHLHVRMLGGQPHEPELVRRFASGSVPDDDIPSIDGIRSYLTGQREALLAHLRGLSEADLAIKPTDQAKAIYREWFQILAWHEAHHHGQAHLTYNLSRASNGIASGS